MRWPWSRQEQEPATETGGTGTLDEDEQGWLEDEDAGGAGAEGEGDPLADFDEDTRAAVQDYARNQVEAERARYREAAAARGLAFDSEGSPVIGDVNRLAAWLQPGGGTPAAAEPAPGVAPAAADAGAAAPVERMPNPYDYPEEWAAWQERQVQRQVQAAVQAERQAWQQEIAAMKGIVVNREAEAACARVPGLLERYGLQHYGQHPQFAEALQETLAGATPEQLRSEETLIQAAALVDAGLRVRQPVTQPRNAQGQFTGQGQSEAARRAAMQRATLDQIGASRSQAAGPAAPRQLDPDAQRLAAIFDMSAEELHAADDNEGRGLRQVWARQARQRQGARR